VAIRLRPPQATISLDPPVRRRYTGIMRRTLETLRRSSGRAAVLIPAIGAGIWLISRYAIRRQDVNPYGTASYYQVAFAAATLSLFLSASSVAPAWSWSRGRRVAQVLAPVTLASLSLALLDAWTSSGPAFSSSAALAIGFGALHLGLLGALAVRLTNQPGAATALFVLGTLVLPALLPAVRPLLDAAPSFHSASFPRSSTALAPILTLAVIVLALPPRSIAATLRGDPE